MEYNVRILLIMHVTHDVLQIVTERPDNYNFVPGQATDVAINREGWQNELRPFTFTSLPTDHYLEFTTKIYPDHQGVTNQLLSLQKNDELILHDVFGDISYQGEGIFIAGGAGLTPFLAILRQLYAQSKIGRNKLLFANKTKADIIHEGELQKMLAGNFINVLSGENVDGYKSGYISSDLIKSLMSEETPYFYLCGPPPMTAAVLKQLADLGIPDEMIVQEGF